MMFCLIESKFELDVIDIVFFFSFVRSFIHSFVSYLYFGLYIYTVTSLDMCVLFFLLKIVVVSPCPVMTLFKLTVYMPISLLIYTTIFVRPFSIVVPHFLLSIFKWKEPIWMTETWLLRKKKKWMTEIWLNWFRNLWKFMQIIT